jgi:hypothetical protein
MGETEISASRRRGARAAIGVCTSEVVMIDHNRVLAFSCHRALFELDSLRS